MRSARVYRALIRMYPPRFRRDYGDAMVQLFEDRRRERGTWRAWRFAVRDLVLSAPCEHWESYVSATTRTKLVTAALITSAAAIAFIMAGGALVGIGLLLLLTWQLYAINRTRGRHVAAQSWWKFAASGAALFAVLFVIFAMPWPESWRSQVNGEVAWFVAMLGFSTALVLISLGLFMGFAHWITRHRAL
jgi:hypothetical protein